MFFREPQSRNSTAELAEQRWQIAVDRFKKRQIVAGIGIADSLAGLCLIGAFIGLAWVIYLVVKSRRLFIDIKTTGGTTKEEAHSEWTRRYGE